MKIKCILFLILFSFSISSEAREIKMLFWYPGEAGSAQEAKPVLDLFFQYLSQKISPHRMTGIYANTVDDGIIYIKRELPDIGIISTPTWSVYRNRIPGAVPWLATLPLPHGKSTETYILVGKGTALQPGDQIFYDDTLDAPFILSELFPSLPPKIKFLKTPDMLSQLRRLGEGKQSGCAILAPLEAMTLQRLTASWSKSLHEVARSVPVPTARVVLFSSRFSQKEKLERALLMMKLDPKAQALLEELRLVGFEKN